MTVRTDEVTIRSAVPTDAAAIAQVHVRSWREAYAGIVPAEHLAGLDPEVKTTQWEQHLRDAARDHIRTWVAQTPGGILGFVTLGPSRDEDADRDAQEIYSIYLEPGAWGQGVARDLIRHVIAEVDGRVPISLWVLADNERARHFYRRNGFVADGTERYEDVGGVDLLEVRYRRG